MPKDLASIMLQASSLLLALAMAGMGLSVDLVMFKRMGLKSRIDKRGILTRLWAIISTTVAKTSPWRLP
ncbi:MAG: hypothetical protein M1489_01510 [Firmicutes bacterium]|nr:hypothetical protein [Bacillota bacterium]